MTRPRSPMQGEGIGMETKDATRNCRILAVDDEQSILNDYVLTFDRRNGVKPQFHRLNVLTEELFGTPSDTSETGVEYELVACIQGDQAIEAVRAACRDGKPFDFAFLDIMMPPGINGVETARQIRAIDPDLNIAFVTAYSEWNRQELQEEVPPAQRLFYFQKPFDTTFLRKFVEPLFLSNHNSMARPGRS